MLPKAVTIHENSIAKIDVILYKNRYGHLKGSFQVVLFMSENHRIYQNFDRLSSAIEYFEKETERRRDDSLIALEGKWSGASSAQTNARLKGVKFPL
jgi:hypothetical protein